MDDWGIQILQFVWFKDDAENLRASSVFRDIVGEDAENTQINKVVGPAAPFSSIASTLFDDRNHQVMIMPGRVDYAVSRPDRQSAGPWAWKLADGLKLLQMETERVAAVSEKVGSANRLALVVTLLRNVSTAEQASKFVLDRIGGAIPDNAIDLMFQMNIPKTSKVTKKRFNRLARFSSASLQEMTLTVVNGRASPTAIGPERHLASLVLDLNTPMEAIIYNSDLVAETFREFSEEAQKLASDGTSKGLQA